jgi:hypothetical protein
MTDATDSCSWKAIPYKFEHTGNAHPLQHRITGQEEIDPIVVPMAQAPLNAQRKITVRGRLLGRLRS